MRRPFTLALVASASLLPLAAPAFAQSGEEEIVVTAQKREELLREVPQSVTAITRETLERSGATGLQDYVGRVPGMTVNQSSNGPGTNRVVLRGIDVGGPTAAIGTYVDETPYGFSGAGGRADQMTPDLDPFDIARVEVLRGPQGTLYGANAMGGVLKFVTQDPSTDAFELRLRGTAETTAHGEESYAARALVNIPMGEQAALRVSGFRRDEGGWIDNRGMPGGTREDVNSTVAEGWRAKFILHATDDLTFRLSAVGQEFESDNDPGVDTALDGNNNVIGGEVDDPDSADPLDTIVLGPLEQSRLRATPQFVTYNIYNATIDWDLGWASLISATSYGQFDHRFDNFQPDALAPFGVPGVDLLTDDVFFTDKITQEFRLASPGTDQGLEWVLGYFYTQEEGTFSQDVAMLPADAFFGELDVIGQYEEHAVFGTATYHFSPEFDIAAGVRYAENEQSVSLDTLIPLLGVDIDEDFPSTESATTWSISPRWRPSDRLMVYGRVATGFRPGGPNAASLGFEPTFDSDTLINYEVGFKSDVIDNLLRLDAAAFLIDWEDIQQRASVGIFTGIANGETARSQGVEWAATLTPLDGLTVLWTGAYTNAELTDASPLLGPFAVDGAQLSNVPEWATSVDVNYEWTVFDNAEAYVGGNWRYVGERMTGFPLGPTPDPRFELPSYSLIDLRAGVEFERYSVELFAKNATDEDQAVTYGGSATNGGSDVPRPRTIGVTLTANF